MTADDRARWSLASLTSRRDPGGRHLFEWCVLLAWLALTITVASHHEPWRDEADSWLMTRDATLPYILGRMGYAGTPALWYVLLFPFAKLGFPYVTQAIVHWLLAVAATAVVLWRSPFPLATRLMLPFSCFFAYQYCVIARSYALTVLLLWLIAAFYRGRLGRPLAYASLVFLLFNANVHSFFFAWTITASYAWDLYRRAIRKERETIALGVMALGGLVAYLQLRSPDDANIAGLISNYLPHAPLKTLQGMFFPLVTIEWIWIYGAVTLALLTFGIARSRQAVFILWASYAALLYVFVFKWFSGLRHIGLAFAVLIFAVWVALESDPEGRTRARLRAGLLLLNLSLVASIGATAWFSYLDVRYAFSGGKEMAEYIRANGLERDHVIASHTAPASESILPYLGSTRFWYAGIEQFGTFMTWDRTYKRGLDVSYPEAERRTRARFEGKEKYLLLLNLRMPSPARTGYRLLYTNRVSIFAKADERFFLYQPLGEK